MSSIASPDRSPATSSHSASALNLIGGTWVEGHGNESRDIYNPADTAEANAEVIQTVIRMNENHAGVYGTVVRTGKLRVGQVLSLRA